jgi:type IV fimbrial biogenesis protein FimT
MQMLRKGRCGFTLIELMVTLALVAILAALAGPSIDLLARRVRLDSDTERFQSTLSYARSEAVKRSTTVSVVPSAGGFSGGWRVFTDDGTLNPDCTLTAAQGEALLRVQDPLSTSTNIMVAASPASEATAIACAVAQPTPPACISYKRDGTAINTDGSFLAFTYCLRDQSNPTGMFRAVIINSTGQGYLAKVKN